MEQHGVDGLIMGSTLEVQFLLRRGWSLCIDTVGPADTLQTR